MPNQRAIAAELGLTQATVSLALRNDPSIPPATRQKVRETADRLGYRPNAYVASLMARIRTGRPVPEKGCIAVLFDCERPEEWKAQETLRKQYDGVVKKAAELGFHTEPVCFKAKNLAGQRLEKMLYTRGIAGLVLPGSVADTRGIESQPLKWERYSCCAISYDWALPWLDRVSSHHRHNVELAFRKVRGLGYTRIGMCLPPEGWSGVDASWRTGFYLSQDSLPEELHIPPFVGKPGITPLSTFEAWLKKWRPQTLVGLIGHELDYLRELKMRVPEEIGIACINRPLGSSFSGVEENHGIVGETVAEMVISGILRNDYGPREHCKLILIDGTWVDGSTLRPQPSATAADAKATLAHRDKQSRR